jgi:hypothetical protein
MMVPLIQFKRAPDSLQILSFRLVGLSFWSGTHVSQEIYIYSADKKNALSLRKPNIHRHNEKYKLLH